MASDGSDDGHRSRRQRHDDRDDRDDRDNRRHRARREDDGGTDGTSGAAERRERSRDRSRRRHRRSRSPAHREHRRSGRSRDRRDRDRDRDDRRNDRDDRGHRRDRDSERDGESSRRNRDERSNRDGSQDDEDRGRRERKRRRSRDDRDRRRHRKEEEDAEVRAIENGPPNPSEEAPRPPVRRSGPLPSQADSFAIMDAIANGEAPPVPKEQPNYGVSGVLAAASNSVRQADGTVITLKYHEPPEARKPPARDDWRLFVFKGDGDLADTVPLSSRSCWLVGRDAAVTDLPAEHPSVSKQHAVVQFRHVEKRNEFGDRVGGVKPYLIDLESANGTVLNGDRVPASRYLELRHKDVVKLGLSSREYVVMLAPKD